MSRNQLEEEHSRQRKPAENMKGDWCTGALGGTDGKWCGMGLGGGEGPSCTMGKNLDCILRAMLRH